MPGKRTLERLADELAKRARAWAAERMEAGPTEGTAKEGLYFGPRNRRTHVAIELKAGGGSWVTVAAWGPNRNQGGAAEKNEIEAALKLVDEELHAMLLDLQGLLSWLRSGKTDLRALVDEVEIVQVMEA